MGDGKEALAQAREERKREAARARTAGPHGWIQWKGTSVCMDVWCACGELTHVDAEFAYTIRCGACGQLYDVLGEVILVPVPKEAEDEEGRNAPVVST